MKSKSYDVLIVGAGPAGMFAAYELINKSPNLKIALLDRGNRIEKRKKNEVMCGFGGAGTFSDGKLHYTPILSHQKALSVISESKYKKIIDEVDEIYTQFGVDSEYYPKDMSVADEIVQLCERNDIRIFVRRMRHVGTDKLFDVMLSFQNYLEEKGVEIIGNAEVKDVIVEKGTAKGVELVNGKTLKASKVLVATGRVGALWLQRVCKKNGINVFFDKVEVGVRYEFPSSIMKDFEENMYESIYEVRTKTFDDVVRTFCPCPNGKVAMEDYQGYVCVNGHSNSDHQSANSNFAFVTEIELTEPQDNTTEYAQAIAGLANTIGGGKPIIQRLADLRMGRRSTWNRIEKSFLEPTLKDVTPGDISMALPHRVVTNIIEGLDKLASIAPGINNGANFLYAPEVKYRGSKVLTDKNLETSVKGLFVAGDAAGLSGNIIGAACTGIMAARGMMGSV